MMNLSFKSWNLRSPVMFYSIFWNSRHCHQLLPLFSLNKRFTSSIQVSIWMKPSNNKMFKYRCWLLVFYLVLQPYLLIIILQSRNFSGSIYQHVHAQKHDMSYKKYRNNISITTETTPSCCT